MRRFRILFALGSLVLLVPIALLVHRALDSAAVERRMRHQVVAERLFDEMERALTVFVLREEERPFDQYRFAPPRPDRPDAPERSPLAYGPEWPFVIGHFQIDPDGTVHTPHEPRAGELPAGASSYRPSEEMQEAIRRIRAAVAADPGTDDRDTAQPETPPGQQPGSTRQLRPRTTGRLAEANEAESPAKQAAPSVYDALRALNTGVEQRAPRPAVAVPRARGLSAPVEVGGGPPPDAAGKAEFGAAAGARSPAPARSEPPTRADEFDRTPLVGRRLDARRLLLYRTVVSEQRGYRQGLLVDVDRLGEWLREQSLGATDLAPSARVEFAAPSAPAPDADRAFTYVHRFAEPFDALGAWLRLQPLPGVGDGTTLSALAALLVVATLLGLAALYRMVTVVLRYAEQRNSFVAAVTHELKTPLTAIRMYGEMLRDGIVPSAAKRDEYHRHITTESERLTRLVNNVLEFARLEQRTRTLTLEHGPPGPVVQNVATMLRPHVEGAGFVLSIDVAPDLPPIDYDRDALTQVLFNLVDNAVKYAASGSGREITLRAWHDGTQVRLAVRDRGPGVAPGHMRRIFQPFYRADTEATRRSKGTGLGLALVRGLVERMGARVTGENMPDGGFAVTIAFAPAPTQASPPAR